MNVYALSPAHAPARDARARIEAIVDLLRTVSSPKLDRRGIADRLARSIRALYTVIDTTPEAPAHHDGLDECARVLGESRPLLAAAVDDAIVKEALAALDGVIAIVIAAREEIVDSMIVSRRPTPSQPPPRARPFRASVGLPELHTLTRATLAPPLAFEEPSPASFVQAKAAPPKPSTIEELRAMAAAPPAPDEAPELEPAPASPKRAPMDDGEVIRRVARDCLEDIAALRMLRKPIPTETWLDQGPFEQRLLDNVDAFVSLGARALPGVTLFHAEAPAPDPARAFAVALTLGCIDGTDAVDVALRAMKAAAPEEMPGFAEGWTLAPSPAIDAELPALFLAPNPALAGLAIDVLGARGTLPLDATDRILERNDPRLYGKLAIALGAAGAKSKALAALSELIEREPSLFVLAARALLRRGDPNVRQRLRETMRDPAARAVALPLLAISGRPDDAPLLLDALRGAPSAAAIRAIARFGSAEAIPVLIELLSSEDEAIPPAAAWALDFMTNAGLVAITEVPWTEGAAATRKVTLPIVERAAWEGWYARVKTHFDPRLKLRHGRPFVPSMIADELLANGPALHRVDAALELVIATGLGLRFSTNDWVVRQQRQLGEIAEVMPSLGADAGAWWYAGSPLTLTLTSR